MQNSPRSATLLHFPFLLLNARPPRAARLFGMGYRQELVRTFTLFNSFGVAFSILSPLTALSGA